MLPPNLNLSDNSVGNRLYFLEEKVEKLEKLLMEHLNQNVVTVDPEDLPEVLKPQALEEPYFRSIKQWLSFVYSMDKGDKTQVLDGYIEMTNPEKNVITYWDKDVINGYDVFDLQAEWVDLSTIYPKIYVHLRKIHGSHWFSEYYKVWGSDPVHIGTAKDHSDTGLDKGVYTCGFRKANGRRAGAKNRDELMKEWL